MRISAAAGNDSDRTRGYGRWGTGVKLGRPPEYDSGMAYSESGVASARAVAALRNELGEALTTDPAVVAAYERDQCALAEVGSAAAVVRARSIADIQTVMRVANNIEYRWFRAAPVVD